MDTSHATLQQAFLAACRSKADPATGCLSVFDVEKIFQETGLTFGTEECDAVIVHLDFLNDGRVNFGRLERMLSKDARSPSSPVLADAARAVPSSSADGGGSSQQVPLETLDARDVVRAHMPQLHADFSKMDAGGMTVDSLLARLRVIGLDVPDDVVAGLRRHSRGDRMSFATFVRVLGHSNLLGHLTVNPLSASDGRTASSSVTHAAPTASPRGRFVSRATIPAATNTLLGVGERTGMSTGRSRNIEDRLYHEVLSTKAVVEQDRSSPSRREVVSRVIQDFLNGAISAGVFRSKLRRDLSVSLTERLESVIRNVERNGSCSFAFLMKEVELAASQLVEAARQQEEQALLVSIASTSHPVEVRPATVARTAPYALSEIIAGMDGDVAGGCSGLPKAAAVSPASRYFHRPSSSSLQDSGRSFGWTEDTETAAADPPKETPRLRAPLASAAVEGLLSWSADASPRLSARELLRKKQFAPLDNPAGLSAPQPPVVPSQRPATATSTRSNVNFFSEQNDGAGLLDTSQRTGKKVFASKASSGGLW